MPNPNPYPAHDPFFALAPNPKHYMYIMIQGGEKYKMTRKSFHKDFFYMKLDEKKDIDKDIIRKLNEKIDKNMFIKMDKNDRVYYRVKCQIKSYKLQCVKNE